DGNVCSFNKFVSARWDEYVWDCVHALLDDDSWLEEQLTAEKDHRNASVKLINAEKKRVELLQTKITRVQSGYEEGIYSTADARNRINVFQHTITLAQAEINKLEHQSENSNCTIVENFRQELQSLRENNLNNATFEEKLNLIRLLNIRVYPSEDLKTVRIKTGFDLGPDNTGSDNDQNHCGKVIFEPPNFSNSKYPGYKI
ncbi:MAG TPA: hypothetical protein VEH58_06395, partial [Dehalococcoidales bacterium]|nr:hypothetical protein [Dehalococcoidales bacterium]